MDITLALKFLHVVGAAILFGTGLGIAFFQFRANSKDSPAAIATVVVADYLLTTTTLPRPRSSSLSPVSLSCICAVMRSARPGSLSVLRSMC